MVQSFADAIKLFIKSWIKIKNSIILLFFLGPVLSLTIVLLIWNTISYKTFSWTVYLASVFLAILRLNLYPILLCGWASQRAYARLGALRGAAQRISYEVRLALVLFSVIIFYREVSFAQFFIDLKFQIFIIFIPVIIIWLITCLAETNRTPFDFSEGESELVSGFNIEYGAGLFVIIFLAEYAIILILATLTTRIFKPNFINIYDIILIVAIAFFWVWIRTTLPRFRYDKLINLAWTSILPQVLWVAIFFAILRLY